MSYADDQAAIEGYLAEQWAELQNNIAIAWRAIDFVPNPMLAFIRPTIRHMQDERITLGPGGAWRSHGALIVQCFSPENNPRAAAQLSWSVVTIFRDVDIGTVIFRDFTLADVGWNGEHWQQNVTALFYSDLVGDGS